MKVLDIDMDYFMEEIAHTNDYVTERLSEEEFGDCQEEPCQICGAQTLNRGRPHSNL